MFESGGTDQGIGQTHAVRERQRTEIRRPMPMGVLSPVLIGMG